MASFALTLVNWSNGWLKSLQIFASFTKVIRITNVEVRLIDSFGMFFICGLGKVLGAREIGAGSLTAKYIHTDIL